ncbi:MAG: hypothetical protein U0O27_04145 [Oscillospiraceae bacterium]
MNHKKLLLTLTLCLCALLCMVVTASADEPHANHYSCGVVNCQNNDHGHTQVTEWQPWTGPQSASEDNIPYDFNTKTAYIYLANNVEISDALTIPQGHTLYLCLNGKTISYNGEGIIYNNGGGLIYINGAATICDCENTGCIKYEKTQEYIQISTIHSWGTLNLYGGTISRMNTNNNGHAIRTRSGSKLNMYGGTVSNDGTEAALWLENDANIYGGEITCTNGCGIDTYTWNNRINLLVAGGRISAGEEAIALSGVDLTLSGQPTITSTGTDSAVIDAGADIIKIADSFAPARCISVSKSGDNDTFAEPVEGGASLADKAQYFTSFENGKFVAYDSAANTLNLTTCAITQQPTSGNSYTVKGNAPDSKLSYQWYAAKKGEITVTDAVAKKSADARYSNAWNEWQVKCGNEIDCFTLYMNKGDVLTLSRILGGWDTKVSISDRTVQESDDGTYTFTAPAAGEYTLKISARAFIVDDSNVPDRSDLSFEAALRTLVPDTAKPAGGTAAALDTAGLSAGKYICQVTWEGKSTLNSGVVQFSGSSQQPTGSGAYYYAPSAAENKKDSPKTADPGVLLYAGPALASLTGLACTAKKRH